MTTNATSIPDSSFALDDLQRRLLPFAADPAVQGALAQLSSTVERAEDELAAQTSVAARLVSKVHANFIPGVGPSDHFGTAQAELHAYATDFHQADAIPGVYPYPGNLLTFADDSQALIPDTTFGGELLPVLLNRHCKFIPDDLVGDRIPRVYESKTAMLKDTRPVVLKYEIQSRSEGTKRTYRSQWKRWVKFSRDHGMKVLPADPCSIAEWLTARAESAQKLSTLNLGLQAVKSIHLYFGQPHPCDASVTKTLSGIQTDLGVARAQVTGFTPEDIAAIEATACIPRISRGGKLEKPRSAVERGRTDIAIARASFDAMLRVEELAALSWKDFTVDPVDGSGLLYVSSSKTDRASEGTYVYISKKTVAALQLIKRSARPDDRIFPFSARTLRRRIKKAAFVAGLEGRFSGHSGRVGMAQTLAANDFNLPGIQNAGRWKSRIMPAAYTRLLTPRNGAVARLDRRSREG